MDKLKETKVPYETTGGGTTVLVPSAQVHELRLQLATQGLPHGGGVGFEIFDRIIDRHVGFRPETELSPRASRGAGTDHCADAGSRTGPRPPSDAGTAACLPMKQNRARASVVVSLRHGQALDQDSG